MTNKKRRTMREELAAWARTLAFSSSLAFAPIMRKVSTRVPPVGCHQERNRSKGIMGGERALRERTTLMFLVVASPGWWSPTACRCEQILLLINHSVGGANSRRIGEHASRFISRMDVAFRSTQSDALPEKQLSPEEFAQCASREEYSMK